MPGDLTTHFSTQEFIVSREHPEMLSAIRDGITTEDRTKCFLLARLFLQPLRDTWKEAIGILSGKRSEALNRAIHGAESSDHLFNGFSAAVDFTSKHVRDMAHTIALARWPVGQMIWYPEKNFIHVSLPTQKHFRNYLTKQNGRFYPYGDEPR